MQSRRHAPDTEDTGIDLAPMLDFTINLLIFFIITTSFIKEAGVTVSKPVAVTAENRESGNLLIAIRENGDIWMDRQPVEMRNLRSLIERLHIERPDDTVVIIADRESNAGIVAEVMDEVRLGGIRDISIAADTSGAGSGS
jgi:biopolymer transport protein ExbD